MFQTNYEIKIKKETQSENETEHDKNILVSNLNYSSYKLYSINYKTEFVF
jgi:hypothetical protein